MRWLCLAMLGCGRIAIDPLADARAVPVDAAPVACAIEGDPCDDRNICSPTSTCQSGVCVGEGGPCVVASFDRDYTLEQGTNGWYYGFWNLGADTVAGYDPDVDFQLMAVFPNTRWRPPDYQPSGDTFTWCYIERWGGHPGSFPVPKLPVRRWVSNVAGHANAIIRLAKADIANGDGVSALLFVDGAKLFERAIAFDDRAGFEEIVEVELEVGTRIDVVLHYVGDDGGDTTNVGIQITSR